MCWCTHVKKKNLPVPIKSCLAWHSQCTIGLESTSSPGFYYCTNKDQKILFLSSLKIFNIDVWLYRLLNKLLQWKCQLISHVWLFATPWTGLLCPWNFPGKNTGVGCHFLLQWIFPMQGLNLGLLHYRQILYCLSHQWDQKKNKKTITWSTNFNLSSWKTFEY